MSYRVSGTHTTTLPELSQNTKSRKATTSGSDESKAFDKILPGMSDLNEADKGKIYTRFGEVSTKAINESNKGWEWKWVGLVGGSAVVTALATLWFKGSRDKKIINKLNSQLQASSSNLYSGG